MNITLAAADIARRIPEMAKDSAINNEGLIQRILIEHCNPQIKDGYQEFEIPLNVFASALPVHEGHSRVSVVGIQETA